MPTNARLPLALLALGLGLGGCRDAGGALDGGVKADLARPRRPPDLADFDPGPRPLGGDVGPTGGAVDRLFFAFTGDTRPENADDTAHYPRKTIEAIFARMAAADVQFAVDLGDHMYVVDQPAEAAVQMGFYMEAVKRLGPRTLFMSMGNHDCNAGNCWYDEADANYVAFMAALAPVSTRAWYRFDIATRAGKAAFVVLADNYVDANALPWLESTLAEADRSARYTILVRHHPPGTSGTTYSLIDHIVQRHRYALYLTGHLHHYERDRDDPTGRTLIYGLGGVPGSGPGWGYGTVQQGLDDRLYVRIYTTATDEPIDGWAVGPNPTE